MTGIRDMPTEDREYSTHGGFSLTTFLTIIPSASSSLSCLLRMCDVMPLKKLCSSLNLIGPLSRRHTMYGLYFPPMMDIVLMIGVSSIGLVNSIPRMLADRYPLAV